MADIDRAVAQSIVDKRLAVEESHFSQRMMRQQQLLDISEARVCELEDENKKLISRLAAADAQKLKLDETIATQQLNLQRICDELSDLKDKLAEARDAGAVEVATAAARHAREMQDQQQAAVESARAFKALLQQRDAKIAELSHLVNVLTPSKVRMVTCDFFKSCPCNASRSRRIFSCHVRDKMQHFRLSLILLLRGCTIRTPGARLQYNDHFLALSDFKQLCQRSSIFVTTMPSILLHIKIKFSQNLPIYSL